MHTQDAMSEAVEGAELILYGVSAKYKERYACSFSGWYLDLCMWLSC